MKITTLLKVSKRRIFFHLNMVEATLECLKKPFEISWVFGCANRNIYWLFKIGKKLCILNALVENELELSIRVIIKKRVLFRVGL